MSLPGRRRDVRLADVYAKQVELGAQLAVMTEQLRQLPDHETRIRALERWRYSLPVAAVASAGSLILALAGWLRR